MPNLVLFFVLIAPVAFCYTIGVYIVGFLQESAELRKFPAMNGFTYFVLSLLCYLAFAIDAGFGEYFGWHENTRLWILFLFWFISAPFAFTGTNRYILFPARRQDQEVTST